MRRIILKMHDGDYMIEFDPEPEKATTNHTEHSNYVCIVKYS